MYSLVIIIKGTSDGVFIREIEGFTSYEKAQKAETAIRKEYPGSLSITVTVVAK